jgi:CDP-glucose 4,6-dehydratase
VVLSVTSDKCYDNKEWVWGYREHEALGGYDPYSSSKAASELVTSSYRTSYLRASGIGVATARAGNVIGGGDWATNRIVPDCIRALQSANPISIRSPRATRPWQHVLEPLGGYLLVGGLLNDQPLTYSGAYNFGPNPNDHLTVKELLELALKTWGSGNWKDTSNPNQLHEANLLKLDITKAKEKLQWSPKLNATSTINWTMDWYKQNISDQFAYTLAQINQYMNL